MYEKFKLIMNDVTVEPAALFYFSTYMIMDAVNTELLIQKTNGGNSTVEPNLNIPCSNQTQDAGIEFASKINSKYKAMMFFICIIYAMFATCWSDEAGRRRKPLIVLPIVSQIILGLAGCLHSYYWHWNPIYAAITEFVVEAMGGGISLITIAIQIYICDVSNKEDRTMRMGLLHAVKILCLPLGKGSAGFVLHAFGFFYSYLFCFVLSCIALIFAVVLVEDISVPVRNQRYSYFSRVFSLAGVRDSFKVIFKKSLGRKRIVVVVLLIINCSILFVVQGEKTVFYLFLKNKFCWNQQQYSAFSLYKYAGIMLGTIFCSVVMSKIFKIHDGLIGAFAGFWDTIAVIGFLFVTKEWHLYIVPLFDIFHGTALAVCISFLSKYYDSSEFGRLSAVQNVFSLVIPLCHPAYNILFQKTKDFFPSAFFLISVVINIAIFLLYCLSYSLAKKTSR